MLRYKLRTLLIVLSLGPPLVAPALCRVLTPLVCPPQKLVQLLDGKECDCMQATLAELRGEPLLAEE